MKNLNFIPRHDAGKDLWIRNFANKLSLYAAKYGISNAEVTDLQQGAAFFAFWLNYQHQLLEYAKKVTQFKNEARNGKSTSYLASILPVFPTLGTPPPTVPPGIFIRANSLAMRIKKHVAYTVADGADLGLENILQAIADPAEAKPVIELRLVDGGYPEIIWKKKNMTAIEIHVDRGDGAFQFLVTDIYPNYTDTTLPEKGTAAIWKYKAIYLLKDKKVGKWSDEVSITVTG